MIAYAQVIVEMTPIVIKKVIEKKHRKIKANLKSKLIAAIILKMEIYMEKT